MKKLMLVALAALFCTAAFSQDFSKLANYQFESKEDYKAKEPQVKECAQYVTSKPLVKDDANRLVASQFIVMWMTGTPDYTFTIGKGFELVSAKKSETELMGIYLAAMISFVLDNPDKAKDVPVVEKAAVVAVVNYYSNAANNAKPNKKVQKLIDAKNAGTLDDAIKL